MWPARWGITCSSWPSPVRLRRVFDRFRTLKVQDLEGDELLYRQMRDSYGQWFDGGMGAAAIKSRLESFDLTAEAAKLREIVKTGKGQKRTRALKRFKEQFKGSPLAENATVEQMPESYRVKLTDPTKFPVVSSAFTGRPGIEDVQDQRQSLDRLFKALAGLQALGLAIALAMLFVTVLLIANTMRVASFSRLRETSIMRLVGASSTAIQMPFVLEAAVSAFGGGVFASLGMVAVKVFLIDRTLASTFRFTTFIGWDVVLWTIPTVIGTGDRKSTRLNSSLT